MKKYGTPINDDENWRNSLYKDDYDQRGFAVSLGHLEYFCKWEIPDTDIILKLSGDNYKISHIIGYKRFKKERFK